MKVNLRSVLLNKEITDLTTDKTVYLLHAINAKPPYVTYAFIDEWGKDFAENDEIATNHSIQVDIFSRTDYTELEKKIKQIMKLNNYYRTSAFDLYEDDTGLYHCVIRFIYTKNLEG